MSDRLARKVLAGRDRRASLASDLERDGVLYLAALAATCGVLVLVMSLIYRNLDRQLGHRLGPTSPWLAAVVAGEVISWAMVAIALGRRLKPARVLQIGLAYEIAQALVLSILFHTVPYTSVPPRGWSSVAVWILIFPLVVPGPRASSVAATLASLAMDPLGFGITLAFGNRLPRPAALPEIFLPTVVAAAVGIFLSGVLRRLSVEVSEARALGAYRLVQRLGAGGMGEVWLAEHRMLARPAAVKLIAPDRSRAGRDSMRRFEREARSTANLRSPHTIQLYDFGLTEEGSFYYAMELLDGYDLETLVSRFGPVPAARAVPFLLQACDSLAEAHSLGLIHRDVKPANIYVCRYALEFDFVKLLDFGLVKSVGSAEDAETNLTRVGMLAGSPHYMAPEIAAGEAMVDARSDIYSLGCVAFYLLTGRPPFDDGNVLRLLRRQIEERPGLPSEKAATPIPEELDAAILACLEKDPNRRPGSARELAEILRRVPLPEAWSAALALRWWDENGPPSFPVLLSNRRDPGPNEAAAP
jgi:serine/threonine protein kinase